MCVKLNIFLSAGDDNLGQQATWLSLIDAIAARQNKSPLTASESRTKFVLDALWLGKQASPRKYNFPGTPGIWLIVLQALMPDYKQNASKWYICISQWWVIDPKELRFD